MECHKDPKTGNRYWVVRRTERGQAVASEYSGDSPTGKTIVGEVQAVTARKPAGAVRLSRSRQDEPSIIESWAFSTSGLQLQDQ